MNILYIYREYTKMVIYHDIIFYGKTLILCLLPYNH